VDLEAQKGLPMTADNRDPEVEVKATPLSAKDYARALMKAWKNRLGIFPTKGQLGVLYAQYMAETGGKHVYNHNIGNIKEIPNDGLPWMALRGVWEIVGGKRVELPKTHPGSRFTAFETIEQGADWYLKKLRTRFAASWPYVEKADPDGFARALKRQGYYTADENIYAAGMRGHWLHWMASSAYDDAVTELLAVLEAETQPDVTAPSRRPPAIQDLADFRKVYTPPPLRGQEDDDPDDAA
jgi:hypothetical protein